MEHINAIHLRIYFFKKKQTKDKTISHPSCARSNFSRGFDRTVEVLSEDSASQAIGRIVSRLYHL